MKDLTITTYSGYTNVTGETTLAQTIEDIRRGLWLRPIQKIERIMAEGNLEKANKVKGQLPYRTLTGNYRERRLAHSLLRYNPVITLDIDDLLPGQVGPVRQLIKNDPNTLASFLSPRRHGFKFFVYLQTPYAQQLRRATFGGVKELHYTELERHHALMYDACREYYERLLGVKIDTSGKDIGRGFFVSFDVEAYLNRELMEAVESCKVKIVLCESTTSPCGDSSFLRRRIHAGGKVLRSGERCELKDERCPSGSGNGDAAQIPRLGKEGCPKGGVVDENTKDETVPPYIVMEYRKALATTRRNERFEKGNRDVFLFSLGNRCYRKALPEEDVIALAKQDFTTDDFDVAAPIHNAYVYTDKTNGTETKKEDKSQGIRQVVDYLNAHYDIRRNNIMDRLEYTCYENTESISTDTPPAYRPMRAKDYNSIFLSMQLAGIPCFQNHLKAVIDSDYAKEYNPFEAYFGGLLPWDGVTDYIGQLADTVTTTDRDFWHESFRRWFVGMVAGALRSESVNQLVLILYSGQGKGKSSWIRHLLPPELKEYYRNGMIDPGNKDDLLLLSTHLLINMEEFEGARQGDIAALKRIITQESVTERKVYDIQADTFVRHASFIASTNNRQCLQDISGNRRFLLSELTAIDYHAKVNHEGVYAQALALLNSGFRYWYEGEEIGTLNRRNEENRMKDPVEENLYLYFRPATPEDFDAKWKPAAALLSTICIYGKVQVNRGTQQSLVQVLERDHFLKRTNDYGVTEYGVMEKDYSLT